MKPILCALTVAVLLAAPTTSHAGEPCQDVTLELGRPYWITGGHSPGERVTLARFHTPSITGHTVVPSSLNLKSVRSGTDLHVGPVTLSDVEATPNQVTVGAPFVAGDLVEVAVTLSDDPRQSIDQVSLTCQPTPTTTTTTSTPTTTTLPPPTTTTTVPATTTTVPPDTTSSTTVTTTTLPPTTTAPPASSTSSSVPTTTAPAATTPSTTPELPATGTTTTLLAVWAIALVVLGSAALLIVRRPR